MAAFRRATNRMRFAVPLCAVAFALIGCSTVQDLTGAPHAGFQGDGSYVLTAQEQGRGCHELQERSQSLQQQMQALSAAAFQQMQEAPQTVAQAWGRLFGSAGSGVPALADYNEARAESVALNQTLAQKGCVPMATASIRR